MNRPLFYFISFILLAQFAYCQPEPIKTLFDKYIRENGFSSIIMREPSPFHTKNSSISMTIDGIKLMKAIKYNFKDSLNDKGKIFINELREITKIGGYDIDLHLIDKGNEIFMLSKRIDDEINELILGLINDDSTSALFWFEGRLKISGVSGYRFSDLRQYIRRGINIGNLEFNKNGEYSVFPEIFEMIPKFHPFLFDFYYPKPKKKDKSKMGESEGIQEN